MHIVRAVVVTAAAFCGIVQAYKSPMEYEREFAEWLQSYSFSFPDPLEYARRLENYIANDLYILKHNIENMHSGTKLGHNEYSHLSYDEFKSRMLGLALPESYLEKLLAQRQEGLFQDVQVPDEVDWVKKGAVTPVKNQGMCGSCWAFSTTGAVEGATFISSGTLPNLSEQELVDCDDNGDMGCNGGLMDHAFEWIEDHNGICSEDDYEYQAKKGVCRTCEEVVKVTGYQDVNPNDEHALKVAVAQQPVSIAIEADQRAFQFYKSGVFNLTCGTRLDHGVLAVGYGVDDGQKYWKVKNSWGKTWGENGYIRLAREANGPAGQCGIAMAPSYPFATLINKKQTAETRNFEPVKTESKSTQTSYSKIFSSSKITQCGDKDKSIILFDHLEVTPASPKRGKPVVFFGNGDAKQDIDSASFKLLVTLGGEQVFGHTGVLCGDTHIPLPLGLGHIDVHGFKCPMKKGKFSDLKVDVNLPIIAPEGNYEIQLLSGDSSSDDSFFCVHVTLDLEEDGVVMPKSRVYEPLADM